MTDPNKDQAKQGTSTTLSKDVNRKPVIIETTEEKKEPATLDERLAQMESNPIQVSDSDTSVASEKKEEFELKSESAPESAPETAQIPTTAAKLETKPESAPAKIVHEKEQSIDSETDPSRKTLMVLVAGIIIGAIITSLIL